MSEKVNLITEQLGALVSCESPSSSVDAAGRVVELASNIGEWWLGSPAKVVRCGGRPHLTWSFGPAPRVLLLGHLDTVWPLGTIDRWPYNVSGDRATGPGVFDMKAGVIELFVALGGLNDPEHVEVLLTTDEEIGSPTSRPLIEDAARKVTAVLVLEPSADGALKLERKGISMYEFVIGGRAAHAGLQPELGVNSVVEAAHLILAAISQCRWDLGTTVTPTVVSGGTTINTVPMSTTLSVDVRAKTKSEQERVDRYFRGRTPVVCGAEVTLEGGINRPPLELAQSARLFDLAEEIAGTCGITELCGAAVGGGSDGNLTAGLGLETLDGLGAVGDHAHAEGEWASIGAIEERAQLVAGLVERIRHSPQRLGHR